MDIIVWGQRQSLPGARTGEGGGDRPRGGNWMRVHPGVELDQGGQSFYLTLGVRAWDRMAVSSQEGGAGVQGGPPAWRTRTSIQRPGGNSAPAERAWSMAAQELGHREQESSSQASRTGSPIRLPGLNR